MDHIGIDTEEVGNRGLLAGVSLPLAHFEGAEDLPRALFVREVLGREDSVVASARAEREGEDLSLEAVERLGEPVQASVDRRGVRDVLLRTEAGGRVLLRRQGSAFEVSAAGLAGTPVRKLAESIATAIRVEREHDTRVPVAFWSAGGSEGLFGGPEPRWRRLALPRFADIEDNYPATACEQLRRLYAEPSGEALGGRLALWHGAPGTGKTWALRALGREWRDWADLHYVTDPERLLGGDTAYMLAALAGCSDPLHDRGEDEEAPARQGETSERWRLLVLEDAGELLGAAAPAEVGRGFSRLLNIADGLLGQATRALILITTNEPLGKLHPAALRPGRAMTVVEFSALSPAEASAWLAARGVERRASKATTIAELHAILSGKDGESAGQPRAGFGFA